MKQTLLHDGPKNSKSVFVFAHGAGAPMDSEFMDIIARGLGKRKIHVVRFEFPYMAKRRADGKRRPPDSQKLLESTWQEVVSAIPKKSSVFVGGKSMGGRIASLVVEELNAKGLICLGYPFHAAGKTEAPKKRIEHLLEIKTPTLILQGERDPMGPQTEVSKYKFPRKVRTQFFRDGDHGLKPRKSSGETLEGHLETAIKSIESFILKHAR